MAAGGRHAVGQRVHGLYTSAPNTDQGGMVGGHGQLRLLGSVELSRDGTTIPLGGPHQRAILAFLALNAGSTVVAPPLIDAGWGERTPASVAKSLTTLLSRVRHATNGSGISIEHTGVGYCCDLPADALDVKLFERACDEAAADLAVGHADLAVRRWRAALELWRGDA